MSTPSVNSFRALHKLKLKPKRDAGVQITKAGGYFKARFPGRSNFTFGATTEEAISRLRSAKSKGWRIAPVLVSRLEQQLMDGLR